MRTRTPSYISHRWHRAMLSGGAAQTTMEPQCGWFLRQYGKKGSPEFRMVPASIRLQGETDEAGELTGPETMVCEVGGVTKDVMDEWTYLAKRPISQEEYMRLLEVGFAADEPVPQPPTGGSGPAGARAATTEEGLPY